MTYALVTVTTAADTTDSYADADVSVGADGSLVVTDTVGRHPYAPADWTNVNTTP